MYFPYIKELGKHFLILYDLLSEYEYLFAVLKMEFLISKTNISAGSQTAGQVVQFGSGWEGVSMTSLHRFLTFVIECSQLGWAIKCFGLLISEVSSATSGAVAKLFN